MKYGNEACDDNNTVNSDGCTSTCAATENGWSCTAPMFGKTTCTAICSSTNPWVVGTYTCSQANSANGDGCDSNCQTEAGWICNNTNTGSFSTCYTNCGNGT